MTLLIVKTLAFSQNINPSPTGNAKAAGPRIYGRCALINRAQTPTDPEVKPKAPL